MKPPATISITLSAVVAALLAANTHAASCGTFEVAKLYVDGDVIRCTASTGLVPGDVPSAEVLARVCSDSDCTAAIASIRDLDLGDCTISGVALETQFIAPIEAYCGTATTSTSTSTTTAGSSSSASSTIVTTPTPTTSSGASMHAELVGATAVAVMVILAGMIAN